MSPFVTDDVRGVIVGARFQGKGYCFTGKISCDLLIVFDPGIDDQSTVCGDQPGETAEGMTDVIEILEEIKMVFFYI
jgi:hypothetical protein